MSQSDTPFSVFAQSLIRDENRVLNQSDYLDASRQRFEATVDLCKRLVPNTRASVLDVGRSHQSYMLCQYYEDVATIGLELGTHGYGHEKVEIGGSTSPSSHFVFDLNEVQFVDQPDPPMQFDLIVFSEVLEHLRRPPVFE